MHTEIDSDIIQNYGYDIGYYEGVRNTLQIISRTLMLENVSEKEKVQILLDKVAKEIDDAIDCQKDSERAYIQMDADLNFNCY